MFYRVIYFGFLVLLFIFEKGINKNKNASFFVDFGLVVNKMTKKQKMYCLLIKSY